MATRKTTSRRRATSDAAQSIGQTQGTQPDRKLWPFPHDEPRIGEAQAIGETTMLLSDLKAALQHQDTIISKLEAALGAVLTPAPAPSESSDGAPSHTVLGGELARHVRHIQGNTHWLEVTLNRISI